MSKILFWLLAVIFTASGTSSWATETSGSGLYVTVIQEPSVLQSRSAIKGLIDFSKKNGIKTLYVQIYRANRAWFRSNFADSAPYEECLKNVSEDPFSLLIREAHASGIKVHAWLNLLSLSKNTEAPLLKKYGLSILTTNTKEKHVLEDYKIDEQYFLEPGDLRVRNDLTEIVGEILMSYPDLDGIQFDYIRYPDEHPVYGYTKMNMERFKKSSGCKEIKEDSKKWKDWKRAQVTGLLTQLVEKTRSIRPDIHISTTGCAPYSRAYHEALQDWASWLRSGLVEFVTVMSYAADPAKFKEYVFDVKSTARDMKKINLAVGAYELVDSPKKFEEELSVSETSGCASSVIFHYGSLLENPDMKEILMKHPPSRS
ncbi:MAG TPA: family 10 glycosylhydrolase [Candidatus Omnitrophota bacterium]|nr:family 10 glycosylhydrolase [Candidatus Omnitrophota bacterium]HPS20383.1 family 10 glycosylhydrolase [Candidatus Omnitrophota bacterium]